jgi:hypothetical protein
MTHSFFLSFFWIAQSRQSNILEKTIFPRTLELLIQLLESLMENLLGTIQTILVLFLLLRMQ